MDITTSNKANVATATVTTTWHIQQLDCPTEENLIRQKFAGSPFINEIKFNLLQRTLTATHNADKTAAIEQDIRALGFTPVVVDAAAPPSTDDAKIAWWPLLLGASFAVGAEIIDQTSLPYWLALAVSLIAISCVGLTTYKKGFIALKNATFNINALMSISVTGAILISSWAEAAMVMVLFTIAEKIEAKALVRARDTITSLIKLVPKKVSVLHNGQWLVKAAEEVAVDSIVRIKPGESIGLDGIITSGFSTLNQAAITGESLPVEKTVGDEIFAGTINEAGSFEYRVTATTDNSAIAKIIHIIEEAQSEKAPTQRLVDRFAAVYTPAVLALAIIIAIAPPLLVGADWYSWVYNALVLLVIACPCALVIATPVAIISGITAAAKQGILIKGGAYLEQGAKLKYVAFDKTGTLTNGRPELVDFIAVSTEQSVAQKLALSLARRSDHPISQTIAQSFSAHDYFEVDNFTALPGRGTKGEINGQTYWLGNHRLIHELEKCSAALEQSIENFEKQGKSVVLLATQEATIAIVAVADTIKENTAAVIKKLHTLGLKSVVLSGDNRETTAIVAKNVGIDENYGSLLPQDKQKIIANLRNKGPVSMVGDGINDAPALASADISFAMGAIGSDVAIETADVALMDDDLAKIADFIHLSRRSNTILWQNIIAAIAIKVVFIILTLFNLGTMWMAVFADVGVSLLVVANSLRLLKKKSYF